MHIRCIVVISGISWDVTVVYPLPATVTTRAFQKCPTGAPVFCFLRLIRMDGVEINDDELINRETLEEGISASFF